MRANRHFPHAVCVAVLAALVALLALQSGRRFLDEDELEHLNSAYFVSRGETIYGSFFENHPPLTAAMLQPVVRGTEDPETMILRSRWLMLVLSVATLAVVGVVAWPLGGWLTSLLAAVLLVSNVFFFQKAIEVRPDVPALLCLVSGLAILPLAVSSGRWRAPFAAGALLCMSALFTPKTVFAAGGAVSGACVAAWAGASTGRFRATIGVLARTGIGAAAVAAVAAGIMAWRGILSGFMSDVIGTSLRLTIDNPSAFRWFYLKTTVGTNAVAWALAILGTVMLLRGRGEGGSGRAEILSCSLVGGLIGLFVIRVPLRQYFLTFLPQLAVAGAVGAAAVVRLASEKRSHTVGGVVLAAILLGAAVPPIVSLRAETETMGAQLDAIDEVRKVTSRDDRVLDCWSGLYLTRLPAYRYFYLNSDVRRLLPPGQLERDLTRVLQDPRVRVVIFDDECAKLPAAVTQSIDEQFSPIPDFPFLRLRR